VCRYVGPAPVLLDDYRQMVAVQTVKNILVNPQSVEQAFAHLTVNKALLKRLGPAVRFCRTAFSLFFYGPCCDQEFCWDA
jgi:hypothetical protein